MDNETSHEIKKIIMVEQVKLQYTPPQHASHQPSQMRGPCMEEPLHSGDCQTPIVVLFPLAHWCQLTMQSNATLNMMRLCCLKPPLSTHKALEETFLFDAMPMAPLSMEVLDHQKPSWRKTWGYHSAKAWYLSHAASHTRCINIIMKKMGGERVTDTFCYQHHAMLVPVITATNPILEATCQLTDAINGAQEAPLDKMAKIQNLCALLLGKVTPKELEPQPQPCRPEAPLTVSPLTKQE
jgi:hypothetical protein